MVMYIETGQTVPGLEIVWKLAHALGVDARWFAFGNPAPERHSTQFLGTPESDSIQMICDLQAILRQGSGTIDDTFKYLDPLGAAQWCRLLEEKAFAALVEAVPMQEAASAIAKLVGRQPVDILGLGAGTARHELGLVNRFLARQHSDIRLLLLDISHALLSLASRNATARLPVQRNVPLLCVLGNFHSLPMYSHLFEGQGPRCKVVCMFGYTFANLENELRFVEKNLAWLPADSLLLLDVPMVFAPASSPSEVEQRDPALSEQRPSEWRHRVEEFLTGPIRRYADGVLEVTMTKSLDNRATIVPGSYTVNHSAAVRFADRPSGHFFMGYTKRYEVTGLAKSLQALGWNFVSHWPYASNTNMLCLFQRAKPAPKRGRTAKAQASLK
jgi:transcriptional regulator with XRE-family HTH domain